MRFLARLLPRHGDGEDFLTSVRLLGKNLGAEVRNPKWTSYGALELDVFTQSTEDFLLFLASLEPVANLEFHRDLNVAPPFAPKEELIREAREYFNAERYWEAHEDLEAVWRTKSGAEKSLLQGVILVCAACVHHQKGEPEVTRSVMRRAIPQLEWKESKYQGIDVAKLRKDAEGALSSGEFSGIRI